MATDLTTFDLPPITTEGFFNEEETELANTVTANGSGFYKIQISADGAFTSVQKVTQVEEDNGALDEELSDRVLSSDDSYSYMYVNFVI